VSERAARVVLAVVVLALAAGAVAVRIPRFWSDGATYHAMAWSLAEDLDLRYEARDVLRVRREIPSGPQGVFLKRASGGLRWAPERGFPWLARVPEAEPRVYFAKAFLYPVAAAPLVAVLGTRGLLLANALSLGAALACAYAVLRRQAVPAAALAAGGALCLATVAPVYLLWPQPELFNVALIALGLCAWRAGWPLAAALLLGLATYSKPYNLFVALPLGVEPLLALRPWWRGLLESCRRGAVLLATVAALFALNKAVTGEFNYQGGERKTFYGTLPFEAHGVTFGNSGQWMTTDHLGPLVEGEDEAKVSRRTGPLRTPGEIRDSFARNLGYFWVGRFGGALAYYLPVLVGLGAFLALGPRTREGWLAAAAMAVSWLFYIWMIPDNWYGGGGTLGNRYFLNLVPLAAFLVPKGREWLVAAGALASAVFLAPAWMAPLHHSLHPGELATRPALRWLPAELTMLNDLCAFTEGWRKKRPYGDTEGDAATGRRAAPDAYYLYFLGDGTWGKDLFQARPGFWLAGGGRAEVVLRALEPVRRMEVTLQGGPVGDEVTLVAGGATHRVSLGPWEPRTVAVEVARPGFAYYDSFLHTLRFRSRRGGPAPPPTGLPAERVLGAFVEIRLSVEDRPH
jgi:hypothetical protein